MHRYRLYAGRHRTLLGVVSILILIILAGISFSLYRTLTNHPITDFNSCIMAGYDASDSDPQTCSDGHTTFVAKTQPVAKVPASDSGTSQDYQILVSGDSHGSYPASTQVITDQATWSAYWAKVHASISPTPPLIPVDFSNNMVLAINLGPQPSGGYGIEFSGLVVGTSQATANYEVTTPDKGCSVTQQVTNPYLLIQTTKLAVPVQFKPAHRTTGC